MEEISSCCSINTMCLVIGVSGAIGGAIGGLYRTKCNLKPFPSRVREYLWFALFGFVAAFAIMIICKWMGLIFENPDSSARLLYSIGVSIVSGFFAMRILPFLGDAIEDKLSQLSKQVDETQKMVAFDVQKRQEETEYSCAIGRAEAAFANKNKVDYEEAIALIRQLLPKFAYRRTINIYYGRLLRRLGQYDDAIAALQAFIEAIKVRKGSGVLVSNDAEAIAAAYFNMACYYRLKLDNDFMPNDVRDKCREALSNAMRYDKKYEDSWKEDEDLSELALKFPDFV